MQFKRLESSWIRRKTRRLRSEKEIERLNWATNRFHSTFLLLGRQHDRIDPTELPTLNRANHLKSSAERRYIKTQTKNKILHFATIDGIGNYDEVFSGRQNGSGQNVMGSHTINSRMRVASLIENVKSITLKMVEFPFTASNVRSRNKSNIIYYFVIYNGNNIDGEVVLRDKNYTSLSTLLAYALGWR